MKLPRVNLQTVLIIIALAALAAGAVEYRRRAARFRAMAAQETAAEAQEREWVRRFAEHLKNLPERLKSLRSGYAKRLEEAEGLEGDWSSYREFLGGEIRQIDRRMAEEPPATRESAIRSERKAAYHARRRAAFLRCARDPWLSPPADEGEPE